MTAKGASMADKRGEMAEAWADKTYTRTLGSLPNPMWEHERDTFLAGFDAGAEQMREVLEAIENHALSKEPRIHVVLEIIDEARRALPLDSKEAQDAE